MSTTSMLAVPGTMSLPEAAKRFGISRGLAYELARYDRFPVRVIRAGKRVLVPIIEVDRALGLVPIQAPEATETAGIRR